MISAAVTWANSVPSLIGLATAAIAAPITALVFVIRWSLRQIEETRTDKVAADEATRVALSRMDDAHRAEVARLSALVADAYREMARREQTLVDAALPRLNDSVTALRETQRGLAVVAATPDVGALTARIEAAANKMERLSETRRR